MYESLQCPRAKPAPPLLLRSRRPSPGGAGTVREGGGRDGYDLALPAQYARRVDLNTGFWERGHGKSSRRVAGLDPSDRRTGARTSVLVCHYGDEKAALARTPEQRLAHWLYR